MHIRLSMKRAAGPRRGLVFAALGVLLAALFSAIPVASAKSLFPGFDAVCESNGWNCAAGGYSDQSAGWWDTWYYRAIHNCTRYAAYRLAQNGLGDPGGAWGMARDWGGRAPGQHNGNPAVGAIAWWAKDTMVGGSTGHVAYVEEVGNGYIVETEDNAGPVNMTRRVRITAGSPSWPTAFLHIRDAGAPAPSSNRQRGCRSLCSTLTHSQTKFLTPSTTYPHHPKIPLVHSSHAKE